MPNMLALHCLHPPAPPSTAVVRPLPWLACRASALDRVVRRRGVLLTTYGMVLHNSEVLGEHDAHDPDEGPLWDVMICGRFPPLLRSLVGQGPQGLVAGAEQELVVFDVVAALLLHVLASSRSCCAHTCLHPSAQCMHAAAWSNRASCNHNLP